MEEQDIISEFVMDGIMTLKNKCNFIIYLYLWLTIIFFITVSTSNGLIRVFLFSVLSVFIICTSKKIENISYFFLALLPNTEMLNASYMGITIQRIMFIFCIMLFLIYFKHYKKTKHMISVPVIFYFIWFIYIEVNQIVINNSWSMQNLLSIISMMSISIILQILAVKNKKSAEKIIIAAFVGISFIVIIAYVEIMIGHTFFYHIWAGSERYRYGIMRAGSTVSDPNNICFFIVPFIFWSCTNGVKKVLPICFRNTVFILSVILVLLTASRTGLVSLIIGAFICFMAKRRVILLGTIPIIAISFNYIFTALENLMNSQAESTNFRNYIVEQCLLIWNQHKMLGIGTANIMNSLGYDGSLYNTMNTYIYMLTGLGIVGFILYILYWIIIIRREIFIWITGKNITNNTMLKIASIVTIMIIAYTLDTFYMMLMWMFPAMLCAIDYVDKERL